MLPSLTERDIEAGLRSFIEREFPIASPSFNPGGVSLVERYIEEKKNFIKGPWLEIKRPFRKTSTDMNAALPALSGKWGIARDWVPFEHQRKAFRRLAYPNPQPTIVATGTGSGKTECFLFPMLDAVLQMNAAGIPGIKAIVIYPMNALASDQSKRFASWCDKIAEAGGPRLSVGLYVGSPGVRSKVMKGDVCITDRETLQKSPPDILLTNYKMLDLLLLRREDRELWRSTTAESLRYLVVDELHTFDGAQGTDLACLVRRLRDYLGLGRTLACVGTSATLGGEDGLGALKRYASEVFGADFSADESVITEDRLTIQEYLDSFGPRHFVGQWPTPLQFRALKNLSSATAPERFLKEAYQCWFKGYLPLAAGSREAWVEAALKLGKELPHLEAFQRLMSEEESIIRIDELADRWRRSIEALKGYRHDDMVLLIRSLVALISMARLSGPRGKPIPFLTVRVQMWVRELTGMVATVSKTPRIIAGADYNADQMPPALPLVTCRNCNATAWGAAVAQGRVSLNASNFYEKWFGGKPEAALLYPIAEEEFERRRKVFGKELFFFNLKAKTLEWVSADKPAKDVFAELGADETGRESRVLVRVPDMVDEGRNENGRYVRLSARCPWCGSENSMRIFGARSATLSSALFGHLNSSTSNDDHKLILFSDAVQDAAHRAGFIEARNYFYSVRQSVAGFMRDENNRGITFEGFLNGLTDYWTARIGGADELRSRGLPLAKQADDIAAARFTTTFVPADMLWRRAWLDFEKHAADVWKPLSEKTGPGAASGEEALYAFVPPLTETDSEGSRRTAWGWFAESVKGRLRWEAFMELTARAHSGRTVELAGIGTMVPMADQIRKAAEILEPKLAEAVGGLKDVGIDKIESFITGFLMEEKSRGAFDLRGVAGLEDFGKFVETGEDFVFNRSMTLPTYGTKFRPPAPLVMTPLRMSKKRVFFDAVLPGSASGETWYTAWATKVFGAELDIAAACGEIYSLLLKALIDAGLVSTVWMTGEKNVCVYLLNPQTWILERRLAKAVCPVCGRWHVIEDDAQARERWEKSPCLSKGCRGAAHRIEPFREEEMLYQGTPLRAVAREHTANVEDAERGQIERSFMNGKEPWDVNLLSATPTLEMGIDIGDLSTVLLGSMPPGEASYLQRIGRAGRRDGNALAVTICGPNPHAQYFWADPEKMLAGAVEPPGVFLHAMAVLERQLFALALARWLTDYPNAEIPERIKEVLDNAAAEGGEAYPPESFPRGFLDYVAERAERLVRDFAALFSDPAKGAFFTIEERERLRVFLTGSAGLGARAEAHASSLRDRLMEKLRGLARQKESCRKRRTDYVNALRRKKAEPESEARNNDIEELKNSIAALASLIADEFSDKNTLNLLSDVGLLPNYAFPEEGIRIDGVVMRLRGRDLKAAEDARANEKEKRDDPGEYKRLVFQRPASSGLFEVSPESKFFVNEYVLHVDQVDLADEAVKTWRFCPNCQHSVLDSLAESSSCCPKCGAPGWKEFSQSVPVLELRTVYAYADLKRDRIKDDNETRRVDTQVKKLLMEISAAAERKAFVIEGAGGFGFEYVSSMTLRDFNFGMTAKSDGRSIEVGGQKISAPGFTVCKGCGRVKKREGDRSGREQHDLSCRYRKNPEDAEWIDGLVLYREFRSEALRIRVPSGLLASGWSPEVVTESLAAALRLGLRRYFHGSVDHLRIVLMDEPEGENGAKRPYIVVYDTVPGGTGYLKELMADPKNLLRLLREALDIMMNCSCGEDPEADGCYRCVYQYRDAAARKSISKHCAIEILANLLDQGKTLKEGTFAKSDAEAVDSELEAEFVRRLARAEGVAGMKHSEDGGGSGYWILKMETGRIWRMDPQVDIAGDAPSRPDFVFRPWKESERTRALEMAVFTDGWQFHAGIVREDCAKRQSILNTGRLVWTLTWADLPKDAGEGSVYDEKPLESLLMRPCPAKGVIAGAYEKRRTLVKAKFGDELPELEKLLEDWTGAKTNFDRLVLWLLDPEGARRAADALAFIEGMESFITDAGKRTGGLALAGAYAPLGAALAPQLPEGRRIFGLTEPAPRKGWSAVRDFTTTMRTALFADAAYFKSAAAERSSSPASESLRQFWARANMAALAGGVLLIPEPFRKEAPDAGILDSEPWARGLRVIENHPVRYPLMPAAEHPMLEERSEGAAGADGAAGALWEEAMELLSEEMLPLAGKLAPKNVPVDPDQVGFEHMDPKTACVDRVFELYWPEAKTAVAMEGPFGEIDGIFVLDGRGDPDQAAEAIAARVSRE